MKKEFVSYEQALALKELGFDEPCFGWFRSTLIPSNFTEYFLDTEFGMNESPSDWVNSNFSDKTCSAPLYQQAFRWFREEYGLIGWVNSKTLDDGKTIYIPHGRTIPDTINKNLIVDIIPYVTLKTFEEAELECLKKLIELVKNK